MKNGNEGSEKKDKNNKKTTKRLKTSSKTISEDFQQPKNFQSKNTIKEFEKLLITQQENVRNSQTNFFGSKQIKSGIR
jgi:hypothetical protein